MPLAGSGLVCPRSLLGIPVAAALFGIQALPLVQLLSPWLEYLPGAAIGAAVLGTGWEALSGRVPMGWIVLPVAVALLSAVPRWQERNPIRAERARIEEEDARGPGPGVGRLGITVERAAVARVLAQRYVVAAVYAPREFAVPDYLAFSSAGIAGGEPTISHLPDGPAGTVTVSYSAYPFRRGVLEGFRPTLVATWPDGRTRARLGSVLERVGVLAFPLAGCPTGDWLKSLPCRMRWARPSSETMGFVPTADTNQTADDIAQLVGLERRTSSRSDQGSPSTTLPLAR